MSPTAQNAAVFQACGWTLVYRNPFGSPPEERCWQRGSEKRFSVIDYDDLNAMHQAEEVFQNDEVLWDTYRRDIIRQVHPHVHYMHATASQRREAFLRTLGLWDDSK